MGPRLTKIYDDVTYETRGQNQFRAMVSVFNNVDYQGDVVEPHAFTKTLERWRSSGAPLPIIWSHEWSNPLAFIGSADPRDIRETANGLEFNYTLDTETNEFAAQVYRLLKDRRVRQHSFSYDIVREKRREDGANRLIELDLIEAGPCLRGANDRTDVLSVKSMQDLIAREYTRPQKAGTNCPRCGKWIGEANPHKVPAGWGYSFRMCRSCWAVVLDREDTKALTPVQVKLELDRLNAHVKSQAGRIENEIAGIFTQHGLWAPDVQADLRRRIRDSLEYDEFDRRALQASLDGFIESHTTLEDDEVPAKATKRAVRRRDPRDAALAAQLDGLMKAVAHPATVPNAELDAHLREFHPEIGPGQVQRNTLSENIVMHELFHRTGGTGPDMSALVGKAMDREVEKLQAEVRQQKAADEELQFHKMFGHPRGQSATLSEPEVDAYYARQIARENEERARKAEERAVEREQADAADEARRSRDWKTAGSGVGSYYVEPIPSIPTQERPSELPNVRYTDDAKVKDEGMTVRARTVSWDSAQEVPEVHPEVHRLGAADEVGRVPVGTTDARSGSTATFHRQVATPTQPSEPRSEPSAGRLPIGRVENPERPLVVPEEHFRMPVATTDADDAERRVEQE